MAEKEINPYLAAAELPREVKTIVHGALKFVLEAPLSVDAVNAAFESESKAKKLAEGLTQQIGTSVSYETIVEAKMVQAVAASPKPDIADLVRLAYSPQAGLFKRLVRESQKLLGLWEIEAELEDALGN